MNWRSVLEFISWLLGLFGGNKPKPDPSPEPDPEPSPKPEPEPEPSPPPEPIDLPDDLVRMIEEINHHRKVVGLHALKPQKFLITAAGKHTRWMADAGIMSHIDADGLKPADRIRREGYSWRNAGENIAMGYTTPKSVVDAWMRSPGHKANILGQYSELGVGHVQSSKNNYHYWTAVFATPLGRSLSEHKRYSNIFPEVHAPDGIEGPLTED